MIWLRIERLDVFFGDISDTLKWWVRLRYWNKTRHSYQCGTFHLWNPFEPFVSLQVQAREEGGTNHRNILDTYKSQFTKVQQPPSYHPLTPSPFYFRANMPWAALERSLSQGLTLDFASSIPNLRRAVEKDWLFSQAAILASEPRLWSLSWTWKISSGSIYVAGNCC